MSERPRYEPRPEDLQAIIDTREKRPLCLDPLPTTRRTLAIGDYSIDGLQDVLAVERKSLPDLSLCLGVQRERFRKQVTRLLSLPHRLLVIEGDWDEIERGCWHGKLTPASAMGSLLALQSEGLPVTLGGDPERCGRLVSRFLYVVARRRWREARALISKNGTVPQEQNENSKNDALTRKVAS